ncbi:MAG: PTS sugar transporter subunit IIA [Chitinispirillaceae bacterium]|nr:PTS sugar transporter subunit IIA [Chitinispirillaceae bacterium]
MMLDIKAVSKLLTVSEKKIYRWIQSGDLPAYKIGETYRINQVELLEWATDKKIAVSPAIFDEVPDSTAHAVSVGDALKTGGIHYNVAGTDLASVINAVVGVINLPDTINRTLLADALIAREHLGTTAIGDGIALPHVRNPIIFHVEHPLLALCFLERPVEFAALDGKPVDTLFIIVTHTVRSHLHILSRLAYALHQPQLRRAVVKTTKTSALFEIFTSFESSISSSPSGTV